MKTKLHFQRFEFKYQIPIKIAEGIIPELLKYMEFDPYALALPDHAYTVSSLYYDSAGLDCYYQKLAGIRNRQKLRVRFYNKLSLDDNIFVEIKKKYDMAVVKDRLAISYKDCYYLLINNNISNLKINKDNQKTINELLWFKLYNSLMPQIMVIYQRKPFISKVDPSFRVTIDYNLRGYLSNWINHNPCSNHVCPHLSILEVKFNNTLPSWFHSIIHKYNLRQQPFSKYCSTLEVCHPELSTNF